MKMVPPWIKRSPLQEGEKALTVLRRRVSSHPASFTQTSYSAPDSSATAHIPVVPQPSLVSSHRKPISKASTLSILPLNSIIRSLLVTTISSSKILLRPSLILMSILAHTKSPILSPDSNSLLRQFLKKTFYAQFCAGENAAEVKHTVDGLKNVGFDGVILCYAKEVVVDEKQKANLASCTEGSAAEDCIQKEITPWAEGTLETLRLTSRGDFVALKFTGAGSQALYALLNKTAPPPALKGAIDSVCDLAASRGVRLLFDAENNAVQPGIDVWTLDYMKKYNTSTEAVIYGTYQAYLKSAPSLIASHLAIARKSNYALGVKLVRGAYIGSDPRHLIHDTKEDTDACYDGIAESLARRSYNSTLPPVEGESGKPFPAVDVVLAGHNQKSNRKIQAIRAEQAERGEERVDLVYAQLQGMADEVSCELVQKAKELQGFEEFDIPRAYKYLVWGTTGECMKYLLRRAQENKDAVERTRESRNAMAGELGRRVKKLFDFA